MIPYITITIAGVALIIMVMYGLSSPKRKKKWVRELKKIDKEKSMKNFIKEIERFPIDLFDEAQKSYAEWKDTILSFIITYFVIYILSGIISKMPGDSLPKVFVSFALLWYVISWFCWLVGDVFNRDFKFVFGNFILILFGTIFIQKGFGVLGWILIIFFFISIILYMVRVYEKFSRTKIQIKVKKEKRK